MRARSVRFWRGFGRWPLGDEDSRLFDSVSIHSRSRGSVLKGTSDLPCRRRGIHRHRRRHEALLRRGRQPASRHRERVAPHEAIRRKNGVTEIVEVPIGIDGLALIESRSGAKNYQLTVEDVYKALAATPYGRPNTARTWRDVNPRLPAVAIQVYGPPPTSGTRDSFAELILEKGCEVNPEMKALKEQDKDRHKDVCTKIREDGAYVEAGENDNLLMQKVAAAPGAVGVLGYSFFEENRDRVQAISLGGVAPNMETIQNMQYPGARQMYIYVKKAHVGVVPGIREFLAEYAKAWSNGGYLAQRGLIPSRADVQQQAQAAVASLEAMAGSDLK